jgi:hypothetical protein
MSTWYVAIKNNWALQKPREIEVTKSTDKSIWTNGRRYARESEWKNFFPTYDEAIQFLKDDIQIQMDVIHKRIERQQNELDKLTNWLENFDELLKDGEL